MWALVGLILVGAVFAVAALIPPRYACPEIGYAQEPVRLADGREACLYIGLYAQSPGHAPVYISADDANRKLRWWIAAAGAVLAFLLTPRWWGLWRERRGGVWGSPAPAPPEDFTEDGIEYDGD